MDIPLKPEDMGCTLSEGNLGPGPATDYWIGQIQIVINLSHKEYDAPYPPRLAENSASLPGSFVVDRSGWDREDTRLDADHRELHSPYPPKLDDSGYFSDSSVWDP